MSVFKGALNQIKMICMGATTWEHRDDEVARRLLDMAIEAAKTKAQIWAAEEMGWTQPKDTKSGTLAAILWFVQKNQRYDSLRRRGIYVDLP